MATLAGIGTAVPPWVIRQDDAARLAADLGTTQKHARTLKLLYRRSGVKQRHSVVLDDMQDAEAARQSFYPPAAPDAPRGPSTSERMRKYEQDAATLAESACRAALRDGSENPAAITHLVTVSCSGFVAPGVDMALIDRLELSRHVQRLHVGFMGCHGWLIGQRTVRGLLAAEPQARVLLCSVELCSLHHQYTEDPQQLVANALFSDGAAAAVFCGSPAAAARRWHLSAHASTIIPGTADMMSWRIGDHGFEMSLSPEVPGVIERELGPWVRSWLNAQGFDPADIRGWAIHPGGPRILTATGAALGLADELLAPSREVLENYGNMSSPTVMFILERLQREPNCSPCVMLAFGPGLSVEAALLMR